MQRLFLLFFASWLVAFAPVVSAAEPAEPDAENFIPIAEEVLDTAIAHCKRGDLAQAQALFTAVLEQLDPPPAIRTLIIKLQTQGCQIQQTLPRRWELRALMGHDDNVSQGIRNSSFSAGPSVARIELPIDDNYRPIPSTFAELQPRTNGFCRRVPTCSSKRAGVATPVPVPTTWHLSMHRSKPS